jgi:ribosome-associated protein
MMRFSLLFLKTAQFPTISYNVQPFSNYSPSMSKDFSKEVFYKTARSGGKGGQNVNKVETMAEAWWCINDSAFFTAEEKEILIDKLKSKINKDGYLLIRSSETRSQLENKAIALRKMQELVAQSLVKQKRRKPTKPSKGAKERRLESKRRESVKKELRKKDWLK